MIFVKYVKQNVDNSIDRLSFYGLFTVQKYRAYIYIFRYRFLSDGSHVE